MLRLSVQCIHYYGLGEIQLIQLGHRATLSLYCKVWRLRMAYTLTTWTLSLSNKILFHWRGELKRMVSLAHRREHLPFAINRLLSS